MDDILQVLQRLHRLRLLFLHLAEFSHVEIVDGILQAVSHFLQVFTRIGLAERLHLFQHFVDVEVLHEFLRYFRRERGHFLALYELLLEGERHGLHVLLHFLLHFLELLQQLRFGRALVVEGL